MLLSYNKLVKLVDRGVINAPVKNINGASIDITLGDDVAVEDYALYNENDLVDLSNKENIAMKSIIIGADGYRLYPNDFLLCHSQETFNLPANIACEYKLKSSLARNGLNHLLSGWCDPLWEGSKLTMQFHNTLNRHVLLLRPGMKIGQMIFWECDPVSEENGYGVNGQYNNIDGLARSRGLS